MASYIEITDEETDPGAPVTSELLKKERDNPIAIAEGADGAPRVLGRSLIPDEFTGSELAVLTVAAADTYDLSASGIGVLETRGASIASTSTYVLLDEYTLVSFTGTVRAKGLHKKGDTTYTGTMYLRLFLNGSQVSEWTTTSGSYVERAVDLPVVPGDVIRWEHRTTGAADSFASSSLLADNAYYRLGAIAQRVYA